MHHAGLTLPAGSALHSCAPLMRQRYCIVAWSWFSKQQCIRWADLGFQSYQNACPITHTCCLAPSQHRCTLTGSVCLTVFLVQLDDISDIPVVYVSVKLLSANCRPRRSSWRKV